jgi:hypothetical protein
MTLSIEVLVSLVAALGLGTIIGAFFQYRFQYQKEVRNAAFELKSKRYLAIIMEMLTVLHFDKHGTRFSKAYRPDLLSKDDFLEELKAELLNGIVFANDRAIRSLSTFIAHQDSRSYLQALLSIRKDLWGKRTSISQSTLEMLV